jgi:thiazole synthase ThiGH ThiG subunit
MLPIARGLGYDGVLMNTANAQAQKRRAAVTLVDVVR